MTDPECQGAGATFTSLVEQVKAFTKSLQSTLVESAGDLGASWLNARTDPAIAHAVGLRSVIAVGALLGAGLRPNARLPLTRGRRDSYRWKSW